MTSVRQPPPPAGPPVSSHTPLLPERADRPSIEWGEVVGLLGVGMLFEISARSGFHDLAAALGVGGLVALVLAARRLRQRGAIALALGAAALAPWLVLRSSAPLTAATLVAIAALLALAAGLSADGVLTNLRTRAIIAHVVAQSVEWIYGLSMVRRLASVSSQGRPVRAVARGAVVGLPIVGLFAVLLASADEVFASVLWIEDLSSLVGHALAMIAFAIVLLGLVSRAAHTTPPFEHGGIERPLGSVEVNVVLGGVAVLFAAFVATQITVALGGVDHVLETENLTRAEHARQGFFQLLWVAALSIGLLSVMRAIRPGGSAILDGGGSTGTAADVASGTGTSADPGFQSDRFGALAIGILMLTLVITGVSIQRLVHYVDAFGFTPLRLWALAAAVWIGMVIVADMLSIAGVFGRRSWFPGFVVVSAAVFVLAMNLLNPDAFVARHNLTTRLDTPVDTRAIASLSDDAVPTMIEHLERLDDDARTSLTEHLCGRPPLEPAYGVLGRNRAEERADSLLDELCVSRGSVALDS